MKRSLDFFLIIRIQCAGRAANSHIATHCKTLYFSRLDAQFFCQIQYTLCHLF